MVDYDTTNFARYAVVDDRDRGDGMAINHDTKTTRHTAPHDALFTKTKKLGLFLPLADCLGAVIYDDEYGVLGVSHLGRQAAEQYGATKTIRYMVDNFGSNPAKLKIWLSPAAGKANYPLWNRNNMGLAEANMSDF
jgi:copper oxidase (laccase) domain-containing protein